jgi:hypothetical protein
MKGGYDVYSTEAKIRKRKSRNNHTGIDSLGQRPLSFYFFEMTPLRVMGGA